MNGLAKTGHQGFSNALRGCVVAALFLGLAGSSPAQTNAPAAKPYVLPWIADVVKMSTAGVPQDVIQVYIKNSSARSTLTPDDIVYLRDSGVATGIINTMIEHGAAQPPAVPATAYAAAQPQPAPQAPVYAPTPQYYDQPVTYPDQPSTSVTYIGGSYPYYNGYPYYAYPTWYYPSVFFVGSRYGYNRRPWYSAGFHGYYGSSVRVRGSVGVHSVGAVHVGGGGGHSGGARR